MQASVTGVVRPGLANRAQAHPQNRPNSAHAQIPYTRHSVLPVADSTRSNESNRFYPRDLACGVL